MTFAIAALLSVTNGKFATIEQVSATVNPNSTPTPTSSLSTKTVYSQGLSGYECNGTRWQFIINQIDTISDVPASINVSWGNVSEVVALSSASTTGNSVTAHYITYDNLNLQVTSASTVIYSGWSGVFTLSDGPCGITPTPTTNPTATPTQGITTTPTQTPTNTPTQSPTVTPTTDPCANNACVTTTPTVTDTPTPTSAPTDTPVPGPTATPTPCTSNCGGSNNTPSNPTQAVLGASTMAETGTFTDNMMNILMTLGMISLVAGATKYAKAKKS